MVTGKIELTRVPDGQSSGSTHRRCSRCRNDGRRREAAIVRREKLDQRVAMILGELLRAFTVKRDNAAAIHGHSPHVVVVRRFHDFDDGCHLVPPGLARHCLHVAISLVMRVVESAKKYRRGQKPRAISEMRARATLGSHTRFGSALRFTKTRRRTSSGRDRSGVDAFRNSRRHFLRMAMRGRTRDRNGRCLAPATCNQLQCAASNTGTSAPQRFSPVREEG